MTNNSQADIQITLSIIEKGLKKDINEIGKRLKKNFSDSELKQFTKLNKQLTGVQKQMGSVTKQVKEQTKKFPSWALSIMFAGMQLQRLSMNLLTWGTKAYDEVSHSIIGTITANDRLQGSMLYLGYLVGQALSPLLEWLVPIVEAFSTWVSEHEGLVRISVILGIILGTAALLGGMITITAAGFSTLAGILTLSSPVVLALAAIAASIGLFLSENFELLTPLIDAFKNLIGPTGDFKNILDLVGGVLYYIGGVVIIPIITALRVLIDTLAIVTQGWMAFYAAMAGKKTEALSHLGKMVSASWDLKNALEGAKAAMSGMTSDVAKGGLTLSGQIEAKNNRLTPEPLYDTIADRPASYKDYGNTSNIFNIQSVNVNAQNASGFGPSVASAVAGFTKV